MHFGIFTCMVKMGALIRVKFPNDLHGTLVPHLHYACKNTQKYGEALTSNCCKIISRNTFSKIFFVSDTQCVEIESCKRDFHGVRCAETRKV